MAMAFRASVTARRAVQRCLESKWLTATIEQRGEPKTRACGRPMVPGVEIIIAVASGKGGVGKSTIAGAALVSTPQDIALIDVRREANIFRKFNVPIIGLIENISFSKCSNYGERSHVFCHGGARATTEETGIDFLGEVSLNIEIRQTSDAGSLLVASKSTSEASTVDRGIAVETAAKLKAQKMT